MVRVDEVAGCEADSGRLTVGSKVDIFVLLHGDEKTDVGRVAGILYLRDGGGVMSICRGFFLLKPFFTKIRKCVARLP